MWTRRKIGWSSGFTLIEVMIVVALIALLATIALPSYQDSIRKSRRADAKAALVQLAQFMERNYSLAQRYDLNSANTAIVLPFTQAPVDSSPKYYNLTMVAAQNTYTLTATPIAGTSQANDSCTSLTLDQVGTKGGTGINCW